MTKEMQVEQIRCFFWMFDFKRYGEEKKCELQPEGFQKITLQGTSPYPTFNIAFPRDTLVPRKQKTSKCAR